MVLAFLILAWPVLLVVGYAGTGLGRLLTVLNSLLKLIAVLGSSAFQKATTGKKRAGRVGPWASRFLDVYTSTLPDF